MRKQSDQRWTSLWSKYKLNRSSVASNCNLHKILPSRCSETVFVSVVYMFFVYESLLNSLHWMSLSAHVTGVWCSSKEHTSLYPAPQCLSKDHTDVSIVSTGLKSFNIPMCALVITKTLMSFLGRNLFLLLAAMYVCQIYYQF